MNIFPIAFIPFLIVLVAFGLRGRSAAYVGACSALPFGAMAGISISGANILAEQMTFLLVCGIFLMDQAYRLGKGKTLWLEAEAITLGFLCLYAVISAILMPQLFRGILVFSPTLAGAGGVKYSNEVMGAWLNFLRPTMGNFTQTAYLTFAALVFVYSVHTGRKYGYRLLDKAIFVGALIHCLLGLADIIGLDTILAIFRTASYQINDSHRLLGIDRTIGAMVEASRYGIMAGTFFAYFFALWLMRGKKRDARLAVLLFITGVSTMSSSAFSAIGITFLIVGWRLLLWRKGLSRKRFGLIIFSIFGVVVLILLFTPVGGFLEAAFRTLIFDKVNTNSGQIRSSTALQSLQNLRETWFLGAGAGSVTSNGLIFVWLGNIGVPGTVLFVTFFWLVLRGGRRLRDQNSTDFAYWFAATSTVGTLLFAEGISRTFLDPGLFTMITAAMAVVTRRPVFVSLRRRAT